MYFKLSSQIFHMVDSSVEGMRFTVHVCSEVLVLLNTLGDLVLALRVSRAKTFYFCVKPFTFIFVLASIFIVL